MLNISRDVAGSRLGITCCHGDSDDPLKRQVSCSCMSFPWGNFDPDMTKLTLNVDSQSWTT